MYYITGVSKESFSTYQNLPNSEMVLGKKKEAKKGRISLLQNL
jgi:hypothetical protein